MGGTVTTLVFTKPGALSSRTVFTWLLNAGAPYMARPFDLDRGKVYRFVLMTGTRLFLSQSLGCFPCIPCAVQTHATSASRKQQERQVADVITGEGEYTQSESDTAEYESEEMEVFILPHSGEKTQNVNVLEQGKTVALPFFLCLRSPSVQPPKAVKFTLLSFKHILTKVITAIRGKLNRNVL